MKILAFISIIVGLGGVIAGIYNQMEFVSLVESDSAPRELIWYWHDQKMLWGMIALGAGALSAILGVIAGIKKSKIGWLGALLGLVALFFGLAQSTHMFS